MTGGTASLQLLVVPHKPVHSDEEIQKHLKEPLAILLKAKGVQASWEGKKYEERNTKVYLILWNSLEDSHAFFVGPSYDQFHTSIQSGLNGRKITWTQHCRVGPSPLGNRQCLDSITDSPAIEVAWTKVVEGKVHGYYEQFDRIVRPILDEDPGCDGFFISPNIENPQSQMLLINWKSVDAHHVDFETRDTFKECIAALSDYYAEFVVPWHIVGLQKISG